MADVASILATLTTSVSLVKELNSIDRQLDEADFKLKIAELSGKLAETQLQTSEMLLDLQGKDKEIAQLREALSRKSELVELKGAYYIGVDGAPVGNQLRRLCFETEGKLIETRDDRRNQLDVCPDCECKFGHKTSYLYPEARR